MGFNPNRVYRRRASDYVLVASAQQPPPETTAVWTAARDLTSGITLTSSDLTQHDFLPESVPADPPLPYVAEQDHYGGPATLQMVLNACPVPAARHLGRHLRPGRSGYRPGPDIPGWRECRAAHQNGRCCA